jgi:hypothetical protein
VKAGLIAVKGKVQLSCLREPVNLRHSVHWHVPLYVKLEKGFTGRQ